MLAEKKAKGPGRRGAQTLKELGAAPDGKPIKVLKGKFGPYVSDGDTNATLPEGTEPDTVTMEQALALIAERAAKGGKKKKKPRRAEGESAKAKAKRKPTARRRKPPPRPQHPRRKLPRPKRREPSPRQTKAKTPELAGE